MRRTPRKGAYALRAFTLNMRFGLVSGLEMAYFGHFFRILPVFVIPIISESFYSIFLEFFVSEVETFELSKSSHVSSSFLRDICRQICRKISLKGHNLTKNSIS